ncbi:hypothetical protein [Thermoplasma volcanium GSS1]|uniref:Metallo-beta-lactamase domain-containing protein n=1 Tax=Thermoplasma volcanium (strain ATCC 51530 / DSM 4299 / JCM 9571 / NBRC 15438 / GSS1) TaxID=273116 RepID=Q97CD4_THEVO|nr:MBL fold metallo-hydrolase [Thermoplasma volcanium]BAB59310.1 hypothetical protein [Thermoplasma volcanium GSS1]
MKINDAVERIDGVVANCYSLKIGDVTVLVDSGTRSGGKKIIDYYERSGGKPDVVVITHHHADHIGGLSEIVERFHPKVYVPDLELKIVSGEEKPPAPKSFIGRIIARSLKFNPVKAIVPASKLDVPGIEVMATPGHTIGSTSYILDDFKLIFSGDAAVESGGKLVINKTFTYEINGAERSLETIASMKGHTVLPGHGNPVKI